MTNQFSVSNAAAQAMMTALGAQIDGGTAAVINIYSGTMPADTDAAQANTILAQLTCAATAFSGVSDNNPGVKGTFAAITSDTSADNTGTATHFRILTQAAGTPVCQGTVGTVSGYDLILNTTAITAGSTVSITAATITLPEGP